MSWTPSDLTPTSLTDGDWALAWARSFLRDTSEPHVYSDEEVKAWNEAHAYTVESTTYYRPHITAAALIAADAERALSESLLSGSVQHRDPASIATAIRRSGRWIDDAIYDEAGERPTTSRTLLPRF